MQLKVLLFFCFAILVALSPIKSALADVPYTTFIRLEGLEDPKLIDTLRGASQLVALEDRAPPSDAALRRRAEDDLPRLQDVMQAAGYWTPHLSYVIDQAQKPARVTVSIDPGPLFRLAQVTFVMPSGEAPPLLDQLGPAALGLEIGGPARSAPIAAAEQRIVQEYAQNSRPFAKITDRKAVIDVAKDTMVVTYTIDPGPVARFGSMSIEGLNRVDRDFVERRIAWQPHTLYDSRAVETTRQDLAKTGLFSSIHITHADALDADGEVAMTIDLVEGPPRSVGLGVAYNTNIGFGGSVFWEHRNLLGGGEDLRLSAGIAERQYGLALAFRKPDFVDRNQSFLTNLGLLQEKTDAYLSKRATGFVGIERPLLPSLTATTGFDLETAAVQSPTGNENYTLVGFPIVVRRDTTDNLLDPTIGSRQTLSLIPYHSVTGPNLTFLTSRLEGRDYERLDSTGRFLLAGFAALGSIVGESRAALPADKRLYAGGAGSIRAYAYQHAGPLSPSNTPLGGTSSLELGVEFRYRITDTIGIAPFVEGGNVYPTSFPNSARLFSGGGIGLRYYTLIGPVRLDIATPFDRRPSDNPIQFYISIGQAF